MFTHGGGNTLINLESGITQKTTSRAVAHPLTRLGQTMECSLSQTWGKSVCFYFSFLLLSYYFFCHPSLDISGSGYGKSNILVSNGVFVPGSMLHTSTRITGVVDYEHPLFPSGIVEGAKRDRAVKITPRKKGETLRGEKNMRDWALSVVPDFSLSPPRLAFLALDDFHAHTRFVRSTIPEGK